MAVDYGVMGALASALNGTSEARRNRRAEISQLNKEFQAQQDRDFQNAQLVQAEHDAINANRAEAMKMVQNIPHMKEYFANMYDQEKAQLKGMLEGVQGNYKKAMASGKITEFRDGMVSRFENDPKYQKGLSSATALANMKSYLSDDKTSGLISDRDKRAREAYLNGETDSFTLSGFRAEYDEIDPSETYQGANVDFDKIFDSQYTKIWTNYTLENDDSNGQKLLKEARAKYPEMDPNQSKMLILKQWAKDDMGFGEGVQGTKPIDNVKLTAQIRDAFNMKASHPGKSQANMEKIFNHPLMQAFGTQDIAPEKKGSTSIQGKTVFTKARAAVSNIVATNSGGNIYKTGENTFTIKNTTGMFDVNGVSIKPSSGDDEHDNMEFKGTKLVSKAIVTLPDGSTKTMLLASSSDKDRRRSLEKEYGDKNIVYSQTMVAEYTNDTWARWWDKQVFQEVDPTSIDLERLMKETGIEGDYIASQQSARVVNEIRESGEKEASKRANAYRNAQMTKGNNYYAKIAPEGVQPTTMDEVNNNLSPQYNKLISNGANDSQKGMIYAIASVAARNGRSGDYRKDTQAVLSSMEKWMLGTDPFSKQFQKAIRSNDEDALFDVMSEKFGKSLGAYGEISKLADNWSLYR